MELNLSHKYSSVQTSVVFGENILASLQRSCEKGQDSWWSMSQPRNTHSSATLPTSVPPIMYQGHYVSGSCPTENQHKPLLHYSIGLASCPRMSPSPVDGVRRAVVVRISWQLVGENASAIDGPPFSLCTFNLVAYSIISLDNRMYQNPSYIAKKTKRQQDECTLKRIQKHAKNHIPLVIKDVT